MEHFANFIASSTLNQGSTLNSTDTTITLTSTASFPASFPFRVICESELMKVTGTPGSNQFTVVRGDGGTTGSSHIDGSKVTAALSKEGLEALVAILQDATEVASRRVLNFISGWITAADDPSNSRINLLVGPPGEPPYVYPPAFGSWTAVNSAVGSQIGNYVQIDVVATGGTDLKILTLPIPSTPYTITARIRDCSLANTNGSFGLIVRDSGTGKLFSLSTGAGSINTVNWDATNTFNATIDTQNEKFPQIQRWLRLEDDGTNFITFVSPDGVHWFKIGQTARTSFLTTPDQIGFYVDNNSGYARSVILESWDVT